MPFNQFQNIEGSGLSYLLEYNKLFSEIMASYNLFIEMYFNISNLFYINNKFRKKVGHFGYLQ